MPPKRVFTGGSVYLCTPVAMNMSGTPFSSRYFKTAAWVSSPSPLTMAKTLSCSTSLRVTSTVSGGL